MASKQELLARLDEISPLIGERAESAEKNRKPDDDVMRALEETEIFKALVPARYDGFELGIDTMAEATMIIARQCLSTAQVATFYIGHNLMMTRMSEKAQETVFSERSYTMTPTAPGFTVRPKKVDGGYLVSGRGGWGTGIMHADWLVTSGVPEDEKSVIQILLPMSAVEIHDVWHMSGMAATGSNEFTIEEIFVPDYMTLHAEQFFEGSSPGALSHKNPMYQLPLLQVIWGEILGMFVGALQGMNTHYQAIVKKHISTWTGEQVSDKVATHMQLGEAHAKAWAAETMMNGLLTEIIEHQGKEWPVNLRVSNKARAALIVRFCVDAVNEITQKCGAGSFHMSSPTQRMFRDINTIGVHAFFDWDVSREQWGRVFAGLEPNNPLL